MAKDDEHEPTAAEKGKAKASAVNRNDAVDETSKSKEHKELDGKGSRDGKDDEKLEQGECCPAGTSSLRQVQSMMGLFES